MITKNIGTVHYAQSHSNQLFPDLISYKKPFNAPDSTDSALNGERGLILHDHPFNRHFST